MLSVENLKIEFFDHSLPETAVDDVSFTMKEGEILGIVGESGSGKSLTALSIAGLLNRGDITKSGDIVFNGLNLLHCKRSELRALQGKDIAMIFQEPMTALNPVKRIGWQVEEALRVHGEKDKIKLKNEAMQALKDAGLDDTERIYASYPHQLSGGQRQRVMIAAAMISKPKLLIADEPTTALDVTVQAQVIELLKRINKEKKTAILFISHDLSLVRQLCKRVLVMKDGKIVEQGEAEAVFVNPQEAYTKELIAAIPTVRKPNDK
ncbi:MAG: ABC transporter ATP-binding protein [Lachnospiraceae bacterium]|nr:ABC transporter ATP-binding protein [Lachnospiraceae bacterium]